MRVLRARVLTAVLFVVAPAACGLDAGGRLVVADGGVDELTGIADDAAAVVSSDGDVADEPSSFAETGAPSDAAPVPRDASPTARPDASPPPTDAAPDSPATCSSCIALMCSTQVAACGAGSACLGYRDCSVVCGLNGSSSCSTKCSSMYPGGETAFGALTLCGLRCGAGCAAGLTTGTP
jgi:hypothetical protein